MARPIVFLTDYGLTDEFVGTCHGVIARIAPDARVIDLTHSIRPQDVTGAALLLAQSIRFMPEDAVYLVVVDPSVGTSRRPVAIETRSGVLMVGPDNGLLSVAWAEMDGPSRAVEITSERIVLSPVSSTFHGRDVFAPAAAHLSTGTAFEELGPSIDPETLVTLDMPTPEILDGEIRCQVMAIDRFGNVQIPVQPQELERVGLDSLELEIETGNGPFNARRVTTFDEVTEGDLAVFVDSRGWMAVAVNRGSAAESLGLEVGDPVSLRNPQA